MHEGNVSVTYGQVERENEALALVRISPLSLCWLNDKGHSLAICHFLLFLFRELKKATGDWFYDQKVNRFAYRTGSEIIRMSLRHKTSGTGPFWSWFLEVFELRDRTSGVESPCILAYMGSTCLWEI